MSQTAMFGTNPQHTGFYDSNLPSDMLLVKKWSYKTNGMIFSSAVIANDIIYMGSDDSCIYALDTTGVLKWKFKSNGIIRSTPAVKDTVVYFNNYGGFFYAINANTGLELWHFETEGEIHFSQRGLFGWTPADSLMDDPWDFYTSSTVITDTIVYFGSGSNVYAIHANTGQQIWKYNANDVVHSTPAVSNGKVCFGGWSGKFYVLDALTGIEKWHFATGTDPTHLMQGIQSSPSIIDTLVIFGARDAKVYALNINTGAKIWSTGFGSSWMPSSFAISNQTIFTGSSEGGGLKSINILNGNIIHTTSTNFYFTFSTPAVGSETAFIGCLNGSLFAVDINSGNIRCRFDTDGRISDPLNAILDDGSLNDTVFDPVSGYPYEQAVEYVRRLMTAGSIASTPSINNNVIYFGSSDSCIYAIHDQGSCKPNIQVLTNTLDLGLLDNSASKDTSFYVSNIGECADSFRVHVAENTNPALKAAISIDPSDFTLEAGDSAEVHVIIDQTNFGTHSYTLYVISESQTNLYKSSTTEITFQTDFGSFSPEMGKEQTAVIYPNPFNDLIYVRTGVGNKISIIDPVGDIVMQKILDEPESQLDLSRLQEGIYLAIICTDNKLRSIKIVKNK